MKDAAAAVEDSMPECCIIHRRYGAVMIQMLLRESSFSMEHLLVPRFLQLILMFLHHQSEQNILVGSDRIWYYVVVAEGMAVVVTVLFLVAKHKKFRYW